MNSENEPLKALAGLPITHIDLVQIIYNSEGEVGRNILERKILSVGPEKVEQPKALTAVQFDAVADVPAKVKKGIGVKRNDIATETVTDLYKQGLSISAIAKKLKISNTTIAVRLRKARLKVLQPELGRLDAISVGIAQGLNKAGVAKLLKITESGVQYHLKKAGYTFDSLRQHLGETGKMPVYSAPVEPGVNRVANSVKGAVK
jgi:DNA-binding CsgD family transcriptional regulator